MVYVDNFFITGAFYKGMRMSHLFADTTPELLAMVDLIQVDRKLIQFANTYQEHFDICLKRRGLAVRLGAREVHFKEFVKMMEGKKNAKG